MKKVIIILLIGIYCNQANGNTIADAYKALTIFDYFKAKKLFYKSLKKHPTLASYGLSVIYYRNDNPFYNIDSASKYIAKSLTVTNDTGIYSGYSINKHTISSFSDSITQKYYLKHVNLNDSKSINHFLTTCFFANDSIKKICFNKRDQIELTKAISHQNSDSVAIYLSRFPESSLYQKAKKIFYDFEYNEKTKNKTIQEYKQFLIKNKKNPNITFAETNLFTLIKQLQNNDSLYDYIKNYSSNLTKDNAWKLLYNNTIKLYNKNELQEFLKLYPEYPFHESIKKEISLSNLKLIRIKNTNDKYGYIDSLGNWIIPAIYEDALEFNEGLASVCKNDTCFYINKAGEKVSLQIFEETESFKNGIAIIKKENLYYLVNRSFQKISKGYSEISTTNSKLYICNNNNLYGAIDTKGNTIIPFVYKKLGNFENGYAYYLSNLYGLVDTNNITLNANWDWISSVDSNKVAIVKKENNFGLINTSQQNLLNTNYDFISRCIKDIYIVVKNNKYGFYNSTENCFYTDLEYDYNKSYAPTYYTNGKQFKLIKLNDVALVDENGRISINYKMYDDVFFAKNNLIRIKKNNKYGYVNRKLKAITSIEFDTAEDFNNNVAIVSKKETTSIINTEGKIIYSIKNGALTNEFDLPVYQIELNGLKGLISIKGEMVLNIEFSEIQKIDVETLLCLKNNELYIYNFKTSVLKRIQ